MSRVYEPYRGGIFGLFWGVMLSEYEADGDSVPHSPMRCTRRFHITRAVLSKLNAMRLCQEFEMAYADGYGRGQQDQLDAAQEEPLGPDLDPETDLGSPEVEKPVYEAPRGLYGRRVSREIGL